VLLVLVTVKVLETLTSIDSRLSRWAIALRHVVSTTASGPQPRRSCEPLGVDRELGEAVELDAAVPVTRTVSPGATSLATAGVFA
jgi:hypothetical protein